MGMNAILIGLTGSPDILKASIAAKAASAVFTVSCSPPDPSKVSTFACTVGGSQFVDGNAAARCLGGTALLPAGERARHLVEEWVEWEEGVLRTALASSGPSSQLSSALTKLDKAVQGKKFLVGEALSLADVAIFATLSTAGELPANVAAYLEGLKGLGPVSGGIEAVAAAAPPTATAATPSRSSSQATVSGRPPLLPIPGQRNILVTSALPYVNNVPHLGNIIGCVLSADCYTRFCRARGYNTLFVCGTDEYGTATETKALEEGLSCQQICDKYHAIHSDIYDWFDIAFDKFGRTPTWQQTEIAQSIFRSLQEENQLVEQSVEQLYSEAAGKFLADRYVSGTCPKCGYEDARGDQCDACGNLLNPTELIDPKCKLTDTTPVLRSTRHIFLDLPALTPRLQSYIDSTSRLGGWSSNCVQVTNAWMRDGLRVRCITRDLIWGTRVPLEGFEDKVFYVWFDAPIGYISITANCVPDWRAWWQNPDDVELVQFMGKDNVPFHTVIFPATLLGTGERWTLMRNISVTEYLNYEGGKFSKSRGVGVFGNDAKDTGIPSEVWRYYLLSNRPETSDTNFQWADLVARNNSELLANLGNYINRPLSFAASKYGGIVPAVVEGEGAQHVKELTEKVAPLLDRFLEAMEAIRIREGARTLLDISAIGNKYLQDLKPWDMIKVKPEDAGSIIAGAVGLVALLAAVAEPFMPSITRKVAEQLALPKEELVLSDAFVAAAKADLTSLLPAGHKLGKPAHLFRTIDKAEEDALRARYSGTQADRLAGAAGAPAGGPAPKAPKKGGKPADAKQVGGDKGGAAKEKAVAKEGKKAAGEKGSKSKEGKGANKGSSEKAKGLEDKSAAKATDVAASRDAAATIPNGTGSS
eukprot:jgi/Botrbrau1/3801/Bobra.0183s0033.1